MSTLISVAEATEIIQTHWPDWGIELVDLEHPRPGQLAQPILADRDYPPEPRIMMDGIALAWSQYQGGQRRFLVTGTIAAGEAKQILSDPKGCYEVMTGAVLPDGCDLVIPYEQLQLEEQDGQLYALITQDQAWQPMANIHPQGSDFKAQDQLLQPDQTLTGPNWGILASVGQTQVAIKRYPRTKIIATGNELIPAKATPQPQQVRISNLYALKASLLQSGYTQVDCDYVPDEPDVIRQHYVSQAPDYELLIYCGGVSKGKFDYLPSIWQDLGVQKLIHGVAQRPGKPLWFGLDPVHKTLVFGLPGNPVSSLVCLHRYILHQRPIYAQLMTNFEFSKPLTYFLPVQLDYTPSAQLQARPCINKNSGDFAALGPSDGFLELPAEQSHFPAGSIFRFWAW